MNSSSENGVQDESDDELDDEGEVDVTGILARRLEELRDERWLAPLLTSALARMAPSEPTVAGCDIEYCKIKPNRDINVALRARVSGLPGAGLVVQRLSCTLFPSVEACRLKFAADEENVVLDSTQRRLAAAGFERSVAVLDEPAMIVRVFPVDPALPGLAAATDEAVTRLLFAASLEACRRSGRPPRGLTHEVLHYKPRRSCAIHYRVELDQDDSAATLVRVYGKLSRDERGVRYHQLLTAAWQAALASDGLWRAARPVEYVPRLRLLLQEAVPGRDFRHVFAELTPDDIDAVQMQRVRALLSAITRAARGLQGAPIPPGAQEMSFARLFASQERNLGYMRRLQPRLATQLASLRAEMERLEVETAPAPLVFSHGDFAHGNVLIEDERVGIIDFDKACSAEPAFDIAYFLTHMWSFGIRHPKRMPHVMALQRHMRETYLALAPEVSSERLALYEALDFASYVLRNFRKQSHQASWLGWAQGQIDAAWDRLGVAAGTRGAVP